MASSLAPSVAGPGRRASAPPRPHHQRCHQQQRRLVQLFPVLVVFLSCTQALDWCIPHYYWREIEVGSNWPEHKYNGSGLTGNALCSNFNSSGGYEKNPYNQWASDVGDLMGDARLTWKNSPRFYWIKQPEEVVLYKIYVEPLGAPHIDRRASRYQPVGNQPMEGIFQGTILDRSFEIVCNRRSNTKEIWTLWFNLTMTRPVRRTFELRVLQTTLCNETAPPTTQPNTATTIPATAAAGSSRSGAGGANVWQTAVIVLVGIIIIALALTFLYVVRRRLQGAAGNGKGSGSDMETNPFEGCLIQASELVPEKEIGKGAFGVVYLGQYRGQKVAIKAMKVNGTVTEQQVLHFLQEAVTMKDFSHANLLHLVGVCIPNDSAPQIIVPYMDRGDLHTFLRKHNPDMPQETKDDDGVVLSDTELFAIMLQVALAMTYLSNRAFVHRDLAARNCMLDKDLIVKVGDFGLGRHMHDEMYYRANSEFMLPIKWMAPESLCFYKFTTKSDVWSFGVLMWEVESLGRSPYPGITNAQINDFVTGGNRLSQPEGCSDAMYGIMQSCWQLDQTDRPTFPKILELYEDYDTQQFSHMTNSPLYTLANNDNNNSAAPAALPPRPRSSTSFSSVSTATRSCTVASTYVNTMRNARSASVSSANFNVVQHTPTRPPANPLPAAAAANGGGDAQRSPGSEGSGSAAAAVQYVEYADMQAVTPLPDVFPAAAASPSQLPVFNGREDIVLPPSNLALSSANNGKRPLKPARNQQQQQQQQQPQQKASPMSLSPGDDDDDCCRRRSLSAGAMSLQRPSNLCITAPRRPAGNIATAVDSMTSEGKSLASPGNLNSMKPTPVSPDCLPSPPPAALPLQTRAPESSIYAQILNAPLKTTLPDIPMVTSTCTPKEEGAIVSYQNCLSVQQPPVTRGVETEA